jgi:type IX secretion system PorP/SprF family membrane protein
MATTAFGQQVPLYSQYMFNGLVINPAYAGSHESLSMTALYRKQWIGIDGAPTTQTFSAHAPLKNQKIALGLNLLNDYIGVTHQYGFDGIYAYRIQFQNGGKLSFGLQAGAGRFVSDYSSLAKKDPNDPSFQTNQSTSFVMNFGTGAYYYSKKFYAGLSVPKLLNQGIGSNSTTFTGGSQRIIFFTTGYVINLNPDLKLKPSTLFKYTAGVPLQVDLNCNLLIKEVLWVGLSYRSFTSLNFITQIQLTDQMTLGYAYDNSIGNSRGVLGGSHEFVLTYNFNFFGSKVVSPRYF